MVQTGDREHDGEGHGLTVVEACVGGPPGVEDVGFVVVCYEAA